MDIISLCKVYQLSQFIKFTPCTLVIKVKNNTVDFSGNGTPLEYKSLHLICSKLGLQTKLYQQVLRDTEGTCIFIDTMNYGKEKVCEMAANVVYKNRIFALRELLEYLNAVLADPPSEIDRISYIVVDNISAFYWALKEQGQLLQYEKLSAVLMRLQRQYGCCIITSSFGAGFDPTVPATNGSTRIYTSGSSSSSNFTIARECTQIPLSYMKQFGRILLCGSDGDAAVI